MTLKYEGDKVTRVDGGKKVGNGDGDKEFMAWVRHLAKAVWYIGVIAGATLFVVKWDQRQTALEQSIVVIRQKVDKLDADTIQRSEYNRVMKQANREHRRLWTALGRKADAEDIDP